MNYKDTVIKVPSHSEDIVCPHCGEEFGIESRVESDREYQAEVTYFMVLKAVGAYFRDNKKWTEEIPTSKAIGTPESTGGVVTLRETHYLIAKSIIDKLISGEMPGKEEQNG